ncbi:Crp/Fnr family transcriptional regulator [Litorimonas haliclonae]|uniref:Crp/Fnr family transcriptional regulator n=1 Tax=Litorimonas haliclonae TaxID=2081977 RepID=UPI0039F011F6
MTERRGHLAEMARDEDSPELNHLFAEGRERHYSPGEHLITEGERTDYFYDILSGTVALARNGRDGRRQILAFMSARQILGASSTPSYPNLATALTPVSAVCYPRAALERALVTTPKFASNFRVVLTQILESAHDHVYTIGQRSAVERLASFLLYLRANQARFSTGGPREKSEHIELPMTRLDIADFLGLTIETVSRAFSALKKGNVIAFRDSHSCEILRIDRIRELGGRDDFTQHRGSA